jgi:hypothetical protein
MRKLLLAVLACGSACVPPQATQVVVPKQEGIRSTIDVTPKNAPGLGGGYAFDLLAAVEGAACVGDADVNVYTATIPGFAPSQDNYLAQRAEGAALYDAMGKARGADTLLVTWVKIVTEGDKKCATVHARGVRLRQVDQVESLQPTAPAAPAPAPAEKPATAASAVP